MSRKPASQTNWYNSPLNQVLHWGRAANGEIGIEIEVEGQRLPRDGIPGWVVHDDGSLRGENAEYVFSQPVNRDVVPKRLATLEGRFKALESRINQSYRTSVHVHLNCRDLLVKQVYSNILLYVMCEDIMSHFAGQDRIGNLFCLRAKDAEHFLEVLRQAVLNDNLQYLGTENVRYSAVNPYALFQHGSLEFRQFRGTTDINLIQEWVDLLFCLRDAAVNKFDNPIQIIQDFSSKGPEGFALDVFKPEYLDKFPAKWQDSLYSGAQTIQHIAYAHDWLPASEYEPTAVKPKKGTTTRQWGMPDPGLRPFRVAIQQQEDGGIGFRRVEGPEAVERDEVAELLDEWVDDLGDEDEV